MDPPNEIPVAAEPISAVAPSAPVQQALNVALVGRYRMALICALKRHRSYPPYAQKREWTGKVRMRAEFAESGRLENVQIVRSSGHSILDENAVETVRKAQADMPVPQDLIGHRFSLEQEIEYQFDEQASNEPPPSCPLP
ncbi:MAG TPA: energy transducer TonB [Burkholderiales bacterium]|nr:energy transducer TonB [Burkholderiales bacterium]